MAANGQAWNAEWYDSRLGFVSEYGKDVVRLLNPTAGEEILDVGCGSGDLAHAIAGSGATVTGIDLSSDMIAQARQKYPHIRFEEGDAAQFTFEREVDAVFSNAALHWVKEGAGAVDAIWRALKTGGRFVAEFGGQGNVNIVFTALHDVLASDYGIRAETRNPWYFPSIAAYSGLLEQRGFEVVYATLVDRPTKIEGGEAGLSYWLEGFAASFFAGLSLEQRQDAYRQIEGKIRSVLFRDGHWHVDYRRLRIAAFKH